MFWNICSFLGVEATLRRRRSTCPPSMKGWWPPLVKVSHECFFFLFSFWILFLLCFKNLKHFSVFCFSKIIFNLPMNFLQWHCQQLFKCGLNQFVHRTLCFLFFMHSLSYSRYRFFSKIVQPDWHNIKSIGDLRTHICTELNMYFYYFTIINVLSYVIIYILFLLVSFWSLFLFLPLICR